MASEPSSLLLYDNYGYLKDTADIGNTDAGGTNFSYTLNFRVTLLNNTASTNTQTPTSLCNNYSPFSKKDYAPVKLDGENKTQQKKNNPAYQQLKRGTKGKIKRW